MYFIQKRPHVWSLQRKLHGSNHIRTQEVDEWSHLSLTNQITELKKTTVTAKRLRTNYSQLFAPLRFESKQNLMNREYFLLIFTENRYQDNESVFSGEKRFFNHSDGFWPSIPPAHRISEIYNVIKWPENVTDRMNCCKITNFLTHYALLNLSTFWGRSLTLTQHYLLFTNTAGVQENKAWSRVSLVKCLSLRVFSNDLLQAFSDQEYFSVLSQSS